MSEQTYKQEKLHEKLIELLWKVKEMGKIGEIIIRTVKDVITPEEKIITCFYHLELSEQMKDKDGKPNFYSCEIHLITNFNYIILGFYPNFHSYQIKNIDNVSFLKLEKRFSTSYDEDINSSEKSYEPSSILLQVHFNDKNGIKVAEWVAEASRKESMELLIQQAQILAKLVGKSLKTI